MLEGARVLVTGGTGSFGQKFVEMALPKAREVFVLSRDEIKQWEMRKRFPDIGYFIGDVRDLGRLRRAFRGVDVVVHAAAMKIVPTAEFDPLECVKTNIGGAENVIEAALDCGVKKVVALSTDKACMPVNLYGATKLCAEKMFLAANSYRGKDGPVFSVVRYGNVMGSRGSVIPLFLEQAKKGRITITDPEMTRFMLTLDDAVELVFEVIENPDSILRIPRLPAMKIGEIAKAVAPAADWNIVGLRPGEKIHEALDESYSSDKPDRWFESWELMNWVKKTYGPSSSSAPVFA